VIANTHRALPGAPSYVGVDDKVIDVKVKNSAIGY
jgi:hypothetical protein